MGSCILCRSRDDGAIPEFRLSGGDNTITVSLPKKWREAHPLTMFDLEQEDLVPQVKESLTAMDFWEKADGAQVVFI